MDSPNIYNLVASKIIDYNTNNNKLYQNETIMNHNTEKPLGSTKQNKTRFHLNEILANKNITAVINPSEAEKPSSEDQYGVSVDLLFGMGNAGKSGVDELDKLVDSQTSKELVFDPLLNSYRAVGGNSVFLGLMHMFSSWCPTNNKNSKNKYNIFNLKFWNPKIMGESDPESVDTTIVPYLMTTIPGPPLAVGPISPAVIGYIKKLQNNLKSLLQYTNSDAKVRYKWAEKGDIFQDANIQYYKSMVAFNYQNIKKVEYINGFVVGQDGITTVPLWDLLTPEVYEQSAGNTLMCRLATYANKELNVKPVKCLELPLFHEYFLLKPDGEIQIAALDPIPPAALPDAPPEEFSDYVSSGVGIKEPSLEQMKQIDKGIVVLGKASDAFLAGFMGGSGGTTDPTQIGIKDPDPTSKFGIMMGMPGLTETGELP